MAENKTYLVNLHSADELINHMYSYLTATQDMEIQKIENFDGVSSMIQCRVKNGKYKKFLGMDRAVTLRFVKSPKAVNVEICEAKWVDKATVMTISMFVLWPLTITSGYGIYKQSQLISSLTREMDNYMRVVPLAI